MKSRPIKNRESNYSYHIKSGHLFRKKGTNLMWYHSGQQGWVISSWNLSQFNEKGWTQEEAMKVWPQPF